jgi:hypothetical protein
VVVGGRPMIHLPAVTRPPEDAAPELTPVVCYDGSRVPPPAKYLLFQDGGRHTGRRRFDRERFNPPGK